MVFVKWAPAVAFGVVCGVVLDGIQWPLLIAFGALHTWTWEFAYSAGWWDKAESVKPLVDDMEKALRRLGVPMEGSDG